MSRFEKLVIDLPSNYYPSVGEFLFRYAHLEYQMHEIVWAALKLDPKAGRILTIGTDARVVAGMIKAIASTRTHWAIEKPLSQEMDLIANFARKMSPKRNSLAHGAWHSGRASL